MYNKALADGCTNSDGTCTNEDHLHIGDYVDLKTATTGSIPISASESGMATAGESVTDQNYDLSKNKLNWRVLGVSDDGELELIAGSPMKSDNSDGYLYLYSAWAYENGLDILNKICNLYKDNDTTGYISKARSVNEEDIDKLTGITTEELKKAYNIDAYYGGKNIGETYEFENQYTPYSFINGKTKTTVKGTINGYYYSVNSKVESDAPSVTLSNNRIYKMIFDGTEVDTGKCYWLASRFVGGNSSCVDFSLGLAYVDDGVSYTGDFYMFYSGGFGYYDVGGVRPVISLKSNITKSQVHKIADQIEKAW